MQQAEVDLRVATPDDTKAVVGLYDEAIEWLVAHGRSDQWGSTPFSARPDSVVMIRGRVESGGMWLAEAGTRLLGTIVLHRKAPRYIGHVPEASLPEDTKELYISGFVASRAPDARHVGQALMRHARATARKTGVDLLRLDCYAGGDGRLIAYYESIGFRQVTHFTIDLGGGPYHGCLLEQRLDGSG